MEKYIIAAQVKVTCYNASDSRAPETPRLLYVPQYQVSDVVKVWG